MLWHNRITPNIYLQNVLGGLDYALHGSRSLRGWGDEGIPDPVLLIPQGFDQSAQRFTYQVNPHFGDTRSSRQFNPTPFQVSMDFSVDLSTDRDLQQLRRSVEPVRTRTGWQQRPAALIIGAYLSRTTSLAKLILAQSDSLFLDTTQIAKLERLDSVYSAHVRALFIPLGEYLARSGEHSGAEALDSVKATRRAYMEAFWTELDQVSAVLTPTQREITEPLGMLQQIPKQQREGFFIENMGYSVKQTP